MMRVYGDGVVWRARALALLGVATLMPPGCREGARPGGDGDGAGGGGSGGGGGSSSSSSSSGSGEGEAATSGASSGVADTDEPGGAARITWHQDIAVIVARRCGGCHTSGGIAPFSLQTYAEAGPFAAALLDAVERRSMPPFLADSTEECEPRHGFRDDPRLRDAELELLRGWVEDGAPEGDATTAAPLPKPPVLELEDADIHVQIPGEVTVESGEDLHICFSVDPGLLEDTWIDGLQISPGNRKIVHHVIAYADPDRASEQLMGPDGAYPCFGGPGFANTALISAWAPGALPFVPPEGVAVRVPAGARIVLNIHYHPTGVAEHDSSTALHLRRHPGVPAFVGVVAMIGNQGDVSGGLLPGPNDPGGVPTFLIPANAVGHTEEMLIGVAGDLPELRVFATAVHMHHLGTDMRIAVERVDPDPGVPAEECLLQTPRWDFQWQQVYTYDAQLDELPRVRPGDRVRLRCTYDNSLANPAVVRALAEQGLDAPIDVSLGEASLDEMCLGVFGVAVALKDII